MILQDQFVGRSREIDGFENLLESCRDGHGRLLLIAGQPGIGKTALTLKLKEFAEDRGFETLWSSFPEQADRTPYWAWIELCRQLVDLGHADRADELVRHFSQRAGGADGGVERTRFWLFERLTELLLEVSGKRRLAIFIDDLQCADSASAALIEMVAKSFGSLPILLVATYRDTEVSRSGDTARLIGSIAASKQCSRLVLRGIDIAETAQLTHTLSGWVPEAEIVRRLHRQTEGNPLFLRHIIQSLVDQGHIVSGKADLPARLIVPEGVGEAIGLRLDRASRDCRSMLQMAAILGRNFMIPVLERIAPTYDGDLMDEAVELGILRPTDAALGRWQFSHSLIREVLYDEVPPMRRIRAHADAANALEQCFGTDESETLAALAYHSFEGQLFVGTQRVIELARKAAHHAMSVTAYEDAVSQFQLALECYSVPGVGNGESRIDLALELADAQRRAGDILAAMDSCRQAIGWARHLDDWSRYTKAALLFETARWPTGVPSRESLGYLLAALDHSGEEDTGDKARLYSSLARAFQWDGRLAEAEEHAALGVAIARRLGDERLLCDAIAHAVSSRSHKWEDYPALVALATEQLQLARKLGDQYRTAEAILSLSTPLRQMGRFDELARIGDEFQGLARELAEPHFQYVAPSWACLRALLDGDFKRYTELAGQIVEIGRRIRGAQVDGLYGIQMFLINRERGVLRQFADLAIAQKGQGASQFWRPGYALLLAEAAKLPEAAEMLDEFEQEGLENVPRDELWLMTMGFLGEACAIVGNAQLAARLYEKLEPAAGLVIACGPTGSACFGPVDRVLGRLQSCMGSFSQAQEWFEAALGQVHDWNSPLMTIRISCDFADALIQEGTPATLKRARELDRQMSRDPSLAGIRSLAERHEAISQKLRDLAASHGFDELTAREVEVLRELAGGSSNADISRNLGISYPTVATHVRNILAKTDCRNRTAAAAYARQAGLVGRADIHVGEE